jgi:hypothetical protein
MLIYAYINLRHTSLGIYLFNRFRTNLRNVCQRMDFTSAINRSKLWWIGGGLVVIGVKADLFYRSSTTPSTHGTTNADAHDGAPTR